MRRLTLIIALGLMLLAATAATAAQEEQTDRPPMMPPKITGWLHTKGRQILDEKDQPVRLLGMGSGINLGYGWKPPTPVQCNNISNWGFNAVRVFLFWAGLEPTTPDVNADGSLRHHWNKPLLDLMDEVMKEYGKRHLGVVLTMTHGQWHISSPRFGMPSWLYKNPVKKDRTEAQHEFFNNTGEAGIPIKPLDGFIEAWKCVSQRYADDPALVGIDILNEPGGGVSVADFYSVVAKGIRQVNRHALIIFEDLVPIHNRLVVKQPPAVSDVVYSVHMYSKTWSGDGKPWMEMVRKRAEQWNVPSYVGEFSAFGGGLNASRQLPANWHEETKAFLDYCKQFDISWSFFTYQGPLQHLSSIVIPNTDQPKVELLKVLQSGF